MGYIVMHIAFQARAINSLAGLDLIVKMVWSAQASSPVRAANTNVGVLILLPPRYTQATW